jgi:Flp pilus assembly protein TadG
MTTVRGTIPGAVEEHPGASRGQIVVLFAFFSVTMLGMLGLAMDLGYAFAQRRTIQNAADAAALAGARQVAKYTIDNPTSAHAEANLFATRAANRIASTSQSMVRCNYIDYAGGDQGDCNALVPPPAKGVRVTVREQHSTFFIRVVGGPSSVTLEATAAAQVERFDGFPKDGPFIVCGVEPWAILSAAGVTINSNVPPILLKSGSGLSATYTLNTAANNVTYRIHDNQIANGPEGAPQPYKKAGCGAKNADFNGANLQGANVSTNPPNAWFSYDTGSKVGQVQVEVEGVNGCKPGQVSGCVMLLPLATNDPADPTSSSQQLYVVSYAAFLVTASGNGYNGKLLTDYIVTGPSSENWNRGDTGVAVVRMAE